MARTRKKSVWVDLETTYDSDPSADGSGYLWVPTLSVGELVDQKELLESNYFRNQNWDTQKTAGRDGWSLDFEFPLIGLSAAQTGDASGLADDWLDLLLTHIMGTQETTSGDGVASTSGTTLTLDTDAIDAQDLVPLFESGLPSAIAERAHWASIQNDAGAGVYTMQSAAPVDHTTASVCYGVKRYRFSDFGGPSLSLVFYEDDEAYHLSGGRVTSATITAEAGQIVRMSVTVQGTRQTNEAIGARASLPAAGSAPANSPIKALLSCAEYQGVNYDSRVLNVDFGITAESVDSTKGIEGRSDYDLIGQAPTITIEPLRTDAIQQLKRNPDTNTGSLLLTYGSGALSGGVLNAVAIHCQGAQVNDAPRTDDAGRLRNTVSLMPIDTGEFSAGVEAYKFQIVRA